MNSCDEPPVVVVHKKGQLSQRSNTKGVRVQRRDHLGGLLYEHMLRDGGENVDRERFAWGISTATNSTLLFQIGH
jgi:hypothetical protein